MTVDLELDDGVYAVRVQVREQSIPGIGHPPGNARARLHRLLAEAEQRVLDSAAPDRATLTA